MELTKIFFIMMIFLHNFIFLAIAENSFIPWNADVKIGEATIKIKRINIKQNAKVYNGPQCSAYFLIRFFQIVISPQDGPTCRHIPTCSTYGKIAIQKYGLIIGSMLIGDRLIRCNPFSPPGRDPVPESFCNK